MAKATRTTIPPVPVEPKVIITLELSIEEAETLRGITQRIGGTAHSRRGHMSAIGRALSDAGVQYDIPETDTEYGGRAIYFRVK